MDTSDAGDGAAGDRPGACATDDLDALQISDSMFPTGMFASSGGLELMFVRGMVTGVRELSILCRDMITHQIGVADCVALANAYDAASREDTDAIEEVDALYCSAKTIREARDAYVRSGVQLCRCVAEFCDDGILARYRSCIRDKRASGIYPVALGVCCSALRIEKRRAAHILLYGFTANMAGAALRLGMIQHFEAQKMIHELKPVMREAAESCITRDISEMWQFCPHVEVLQMAHARADANMFIT